MICSNKKMHMRDRELNRSFESNLFFRSSNPLMSRRNYVIATSLTAALTASGAVISRDIKPAQASELPDYVNINMDYHFQENPENCAPACVQMTLGYLLYPELPPAQDEIAKDLGTSVNGTPDENILAYFRKKGYSKTTTVASPQIDLIKEHLAQGHPTILDGKYSFGIYTDSLHYIVAKGFDDRQEEGSLIAHDPGMGGPNRYIPYGEIERNWYKGILIPYSGGGSQRTKASIPISTNPLTIDGRWTDAQEWSDTCEIVAPEMYWKLRHDDSYIAALFDFVGDKELNAFPDPKNCDSAGIQIDTMKDGGTTPQPDDYSFQILWLSPEKPTLVTQQGTGNGWKDAPPLLAGASSMDASNNPYSTTPHLIYEFLIPKSILPPDASSVYGRLAVWDGNKHAIFTWPKDAYGNNPSQWGELELSKNVVSEPSDSLLLLLALGLPFYLLKRYSKRRNEIQSLNEQQ